MFWSPTRTRSPLMPTVSSVFAMGHCQRRAGAHPTCGPENLRGVPAPAEVLIMKRVYPPCGSRSGPCAVNKVRSALTMLGIVIGVAAVIATVAVGSGATQRIEEQIASIGSNIIIVYSRQSHQFRHAPGYGNAVTLSEADAQSYSAQCPNVAVVAPVVRGGARSLFMECNTGRRIIMGYSGVI